jgi:FtsP/CotA-like multicopper oxidase with cupredoxin domain
MVTRRQIIQAGTVGSAALLVPAAFIARQQAFADPVPGGTLDPTKVPKYVLPLFVLPAMPGAQSVGGVTYHQIAARQFNQRILPPGFRTTPVFGFGRHGAPSTFHYPAYTIEAQVNCTTRVRWINELVTSDGRFRPHLLPVDPTLHWANPPGGNTGRDTRPEFTTTPGPYRGPVPLVTHLHGAHSFEEYDGYPQAWYLPVARNIPHGYARVGSFYDRFKAKSTARTGVDWPAGSAVFDYTNDQRATTLWFHSHDLGMTRVNMYAGMVGMYLLRGGSSDLPDGVLPGPAPQPGDPPGRKYFEIPLVVQDKSFNADGTLFFPNTRGTFGDTPPDGPFIPKTDVSPIWNPEFFGNTMVVNGNTWPVLAVERRRYRLRILNACNARTVFLKIATDPLATRPAAAALPIWAIGGDGGFLPAPVALASARLGVAERMDVIVDFSGVPAGTALYLINEGPDEPFGGGTVGTDFEPADPGTTGQVMKFVVVPATSTDRSVPPDRLRLPKAPRLGNAGVTRRLSLNEMDSAAFPEAPTMAMLGTINADGTPMPLPWMAPVTENIRNGATEIWELRNFTEDGHPIHVHQVQFEVLDRRPFGGAENPNQIGDPRPPESWETGTKDTVLALPGEITRIKARFDIAGRFVWHCHIVDHEDNEMMRPYQVSP